MGRSWNAGSETENARMERFISKLICPKLISRTKYKRLNTPNQTHGLRKNFVLGGMTINNENRKFNFIIM